MTKILYLEDEHSLGRIVKESLVSRGFDICLVTDGAKLLRQFEHFDPDICVLDVMVPNVDGFTLGKAIKERNPKQPIIYLTAKNQTKDVLEGFQSGGNDYIKKPFSMEELIVRIENILLLKSVDTPDFPSKDIRIGSYEFSPKRFELRRGNEKIQLSHRENELILLLSKHINQKIDRRVMLKELWGDDSLFNSRNLDVYIRKLRIYFEKDPAIKLTTLRGVGYYFGVEF